MKLQLIATNRVPCCEGGFRITDPATRLESFANNFEGLLRDIRTKRHVNGIPIGLGFEDEIEAMVCAKYAAECEQTGPGAIRKRRLGLGDIITGSKVMLNFWRAGKPIVSREEAERRARICVKCPHNDVFAKPCNSGICGELREVVREIIDYQGTQYDAELHSCQICKCFTQAAIWVDLACQVKALSDEQKAQFESVPDCWKKETLLK